MLTVLYIFQFIIAFLLIFFIFLQRREETTSLLSSNTYNSMFKSAGVPSNPLVKITLIIGVLFFLNSILISAILLKKAKAPSKLIEKVEEYQQAGVNTKKEISAPTANTEKNETSKKSTNSIPKNKKESVQESVKNKANKADNTKETPGVPLGKTN